MSPTRVYYVLTFTRWFPTGFVVGLFVLWALDLGLGTGQAMQLAGGIQAAAKTGTAQLNSAGEPQRSHAWIIGFAPAEAPRYAVAVMLKGTNAEISAGTGGRLAGPIAKTVLDAAFAGEVGG